MKLRTLSHEFKTNKKQFREGSIGAGFCREGISNTYLCARSEDGKIPKPSLRFDVSILIVYVSTNTCARRCSDAHVDQFCV